MLNMHRQCQCECHNVRIIDHPLCTTCGCKINNTGDSLEKFKEFMSNELTEEEKELIKKLSKTPSVSIQNAVTNISPQWICIKNKMPPRLQNILGLFDNGCIYVVCQCGWDDICNDWHYMPQPQTTHSASFEELKAWMPLPEPPKDKP